MAKLLATRGAQWPLVAEFTFNFDDTMADINGVTKTFGSVVGDTIVCTPINLPDGAVVIGGQVVIETQGVGPATYTVKLGDSLNDARHLAAQSLLATAGTKYDLLVTGYRVTENMRLTIASTTSNASAGKATVRVLFVIPNKVNEAVPN